MLRNLTLEDTLPHDAEQAVLVGRAWLPGEGGGPTLVTVRQGALVDISPLAPTMAALLERPDAAEAVRGHAGRSLGTLSGWLDEAAVLAVHAAPAKHAIVDLELRDAVDNIRSWFRDAAAKKRGLVSFYH